MLQALTADLKEIVREQREYTELLYQMTYRDLLLRYKQTFMGFAWAIFMPLVNTIVFSVIFTRVAPVDVGMPYPLFAFAGLLTWNFFASSQKFAVSALTANMSLVTKVYFPREILPLSAVFVTFVDFMVAGVVLAGMMVWYQVPIRVTFVLLPLVMFVHVLFTLGVALLLSMANLFYRDVKYLFEIVLTVWMFVTSVLYPTELMGPRFATLMHLNPLTPIIDAYRDVLFRGVVPDVWFAYAAGVSVVTLLVSWVTFHRAEFQFAESV
jgi:ABC-type polysaccharide/polyol phosphate export permease